MKIRIFTRGNGWYVTGTNYRDENDKAYCNLFFPKNSEPNYDLGSQGWDMVDIDVLEAKFTSYKQKIGMTIYKYILIDNKDQKGYEQHQSIPTMNEHDFLEAENIIGDAVDNTPVITMDELPFY